MNGIGNTTASTIRQNSAGRISASCLVSMRKRTIDKRLVSKVQLGPAISGLVIAVYGVFVPGTPHWLIWCVVLVGGVFPSLQFTSLNSLAYADIPSRDVGRATSVASVIQQISLGLGVTIAGLVLQISHDLQGHATIVWTDFWPAFLFVGLFSVASIPVTARLPHGSGDEIARGGRGST